MKQNKQVGVRKLCWYRLDTLLYLFLYTPFLGSHISGLFGCIDSPSAGGLVVFRASAYIDGSPVLAERYTSSCWHCCCVVRCFSCCFLLFVNASTNKRLLLAHRHIVTTRFHSLTTFLTARFIDFPSIEETCDVSWRIIKIFTSCHVTSCHVTM